MSQPTIAIIGAGQAGLQLAASLRELRYEGRLVLVGDDPRAPYQRPPLSKGYLLGEVSAADVSLRPDAFFSTHEIQLVTGKRATGVDRTRRRVGLEDDAVIEYDHLVLATGARNRLLPVSGADLRNVFYLRTLDEAALLRAQMGGARRAVVVGAGFIGLEFAAIAAKQGLDVTVLDLADRPMARAVSKAVSDACTRAHEAMGVRLCFNTQVRRLVGRDGCVTGVETGAGHTLPADLVVVGIGVVPNLELAASCGLATDDGIVVDAFLTTSDPHISAMGDAAAHVSEYAEGRRIRLESVQNAIDQARCVAARIMGRPAAYQALPWFWSNQGSLHLQMTGLWSSDCDATPRGDPNGSAFSMYHFRAGKLVCVESLNRAGDHMLARRLLGNRVAVTPDQAADVSFDLKSLAAAKQ
jgi:3-phenylpropionate/trans-cinnamate dioxygenase ferredoxin reductase subunit